jgi:RNA polymerase sigma-70 factor (ECF subfamily)
MCSCQEPPELVDAKADPERETISIERGQMIRHVLRELCEKDQQLLRRACLEEEDRDQVCREFQVTRNYLRLLLYRARLRVKGLLLTPAPKQFGAKP